MADCKNATQISARLSVKLDPTRESVSMTNEVTLKHKEVQLLLTNPRDASARVTSTEYYKASNNFLPEKNIS